ncbi:MAG: V-type ATP synthase subunit F [Pseudomonadota bacterium]|nr:V-type ATP synthase subunit F [Pseudomonadota bacterium]
MRLIFLGSQTLAEGFALLGFEVFAQATDETVETVLSELLKNKEKALVFVETTLTHQSAAGELLPALAQARREAARILITEIPPLHASEDYQPLVEALVARVLGPSVLEKSL